MLFVWLSLLAANPFMSLTLSLTSPLAHAAEHDSDTEAEETRQARLAERQERAAADAQISATIPNLPGLPDATAGKPRPKPTPALPGSPARPAPESLACRYASDIEARPPPMRVALTFDDGPDEIGTPYILDVLAKYKIRASFFMIGHSAALHPELVQRVVSAGHLIVGNHSFTHPDFHKISVADQQKETLENMSLMGKFESPKFFRYPYGDSTCESNNFVHKLGYKIVGWHVDSCDWAFNKTGAVNAQDAQICEVQPQFHANFQGHVLDRLRNRHGGILLMHEIHPNTIKQLEPIVQQLIHDGFSFGTIDEPGFAASMK